MVNTSFVIKCTSRLNHEYYEVRSDGFSYSRVWNVFNDLKSTIRQLNCDGYDVDHISFDCSIERRRKKSS